MKCLVRSFRATKRLENRQCGCRGWQLSGLSCINAAAFIANRELPLWHFYVDESYYVIRYRMAYEGPIATLPGKKQWSVVEDMQPVGVPNTLRPRGRPKKKRLTNFMENKNSKKNVHKCSWCGLWGHHRTSCKNPLGEISAPQAEANDYIPKQVGHSSGSRSKLPIRRGALE